MTKIQHFRSTIAYRSVVTASCGLLVLSALVSSVAAQPRLLLKKGTVVITAPGMNKHHYVKIPIDLSAYKSGELKIGVSVDKGKSAASFDLFDEKAKILLVGRQNDSIRTAYDIAPGGTSSLDYFFTAPQKLILGAEGNWFSPVKSTNKITYTCVLINGQKK